jgi:signal transduction histidine kinase
MGAQPPGTGSTTFDSAGPGRGHPVPADVLSAGTSVLDALSAGAPPAGGSAPVPLSSEHAAAAFATMLAAVGDAVVVCAPHGQVTHSNRPARVLFGEGLAHWRQVLERLDDPGGQAPIPGLCEHQGPAQLRYRDGQERWLSLTAYPVMGEGATCGSAPAVATIVLVRDVSDARRSRQAREAFIEVLSHELRTPVTTIYAGSKVLGGAGGSMTPSVRREVYRDIAAESERLYRLVEDLLVLARFDGMAPGSLGDEPVLLQRILPDVVDLERIRFPSTHFDVDVPAGLPTVRAEPTYVEQIARNLLTNAARYSPPGSTVRLELAAVADRVEIRVLDEGPGFPPAEAGRLFDLFYRSETTSRITGGAGIGLFVCRRLVEAMGGRVWARPRSGGGSEFGFTLPTFIEEEP